MRYTITIELEPLPEATEEAANEAITTFVEALEVLITWQFDNVAISSKEED